MKNEHDIKKLLDLDKSYQLKVKEAHDKKVNIEDELKAEKEEIKNKLWDKVNSEVQAEKDRLNNLINETKRKDQEEFETSKEKLDKTYKDNKDKWIEELFNRIIEV